MMTKRQHVLTAILIGIVAVFAVVGTTDASHSADLNGDGKVDAADLTILKSQWGSTGTADLNHNGTVNAQDAGILFSSWGTIPTTPPPPPPSGTRDPFLWPFDTYSPWNMPVGSSAITAPARPATKSGITSFGRAEFSLYASWPFWAAVSSDAYREVRDSPTSPTDTGRFRYNIRIGSNMRSISWPTDNPPWWRGGTSDAPMTVASADHLQAYEMMGVPYPTETPLVSETANAPYSLKGIGVNSGPGYLGRRASGLPGIGGLLRKSETITAYGIRHALSVMVHVETLNKNGPSGQTYTWPATSSDPVSGYGIDGNVFMGSLLVLPYSVNIDSLGLSTVQGREIARALQRYGAYVVDTHPTLHDEVRFFGNPADPVEPDFPTYPYASVQADLAIVLPLLHVVTNNSPTSVGGGGTPLAPLAPPFDR